MVAKISFSSSYIAKAKGHDVKGQKQFKRFLNLAETITKYEKNTSAEYNHALEDKYPYFFQGMIKLNVPNELDNMIENYCAFHNIKVQKINK